MPLRPFAAWPVPENGTTVSCRHDSDSAKLFEDLGFKPVDCGSLRSPRVLDAMVPLMMELDRRYNGQGRSSWKFMA
jgi:predicted dinucleotide-binding enzyme